MKEEEPFSRSKGGPLYFPYSQGNLGVVKNKIAIEDFFWIMFIRSALVKIHNFPHPTPLAFSASVYLGPPKKLVFSLYLAKYRS